jgi:hypothetical protein
MYLSLNTILLVLVLIILLALLVLYVFKPFSKKETFSAADVSLSIPWAFFNSYLANPEIYNRLVQFIKDEGYDSKYLVKIPDFKVYLEMMKYVKAANPALPDSFLKEETFNKLIEMRKKSRYNYVSFDSISKLA